MCVHVCVSVCKEERRQQNAKKEEELAVLRQQQELLQKLLTQQRRVSSHIASCELKVNGVALSSGVPLYPVMVYSGHFHSIPFQIQELELRQAALLKMKERAEEQIAEAEAEVK